ncbi:MAG TPA: hypothetical protein VMT32_11810 [Bryobacteraceae bacterium]|nr:hypothetical protein [Bryobacteraceae bacterium]
MPSSSMSQQDRARLMKLMQGPLIPTANQPKIVHWQDNRLVTTLKRHFDAHHRRWAAGAAVVLTILAILVVTATIKDRGNNGSIQLQVLDQSGRLQIRWDPKADPIRRAVDARLYIVDGSDRLYVKLDSARLERGAVSYARRSDRVELRMALAQPDGKSVEEQATFVGTPPANVDEYELETSAPPVSEPDRPSATVQAAGAAKPREIALAGAPATGQRARTKPLQHSGTSLPFTCSTGDTFRKTDAPAGWDTFTCRGKNVWSRVPAPTPEDHTKTLGPTATTLTAEPASLSTAE